MRILRLMLFPLLVGIVGWAGNQSGGTGVHAPTHAKDGSDAVNAANLGSGAAAVGTVLTADGAGGNSYGALSVNDTALVGSGRNITARSTDSNTVAVTADSLVLTNGTVTRRFSNVNVSASLAAAVGAGGPDVAGIDTANVHRNLVVIGQENGTLSAVWTAATGDQPNVMPAPYTYYGRAVWARNDASSNLVGVFRVGTKVFYNSHPALLSGGTSDTDADVDGSAFFPPGARRGFIEVQLTSSGGEQPAVFISAKDNSVVTHILATASSTAELHSVADVVLDASRVFRYRDGVANRSATFFGAGYYEE